MLELKRGLRCKLEDYLDLQQPFQVAMETVGNAVYDTCCFGVDGEEKLRDDRYMIFYNQPSSPQGEISLIEEGKYQVNLSALPKDIVKLVFTVSIDGVQTMGEIDQHKIRVFQNGETLMELFLTGKDFQQEKAIIGIEIYLKSVWRLNAVAKGFNGGLEALLENFGGELEEPEQEEPMSENAEQGKPAQAGIEQGKPAQEKPVQEGLAQGKPVQEGIAQGKLSQEGMAQGKPVQEGFALEKPSQGGASQGGTSQGGAAFVPSLTKEPAANASSQPDDFSFVKEEKELLLGKKPVSLKKGQKVSLKKENGKVLDNVMIGLGWDMAKRGTSIDCDASVFLCKNGKLKGSDDVVCYTNLQHKTGAVRHSGDNLTGAGSGDDEQIYVHLNQLPEEYDRIAFVVNIFLAKITRQHFGMVKNCFIRICDGNRTEMCRYNLTEKYDKMTAMIFGEMRKENGLWTFHAIGQGTKDGSISALKRRFR